MDTTAVVIGAGQAGLAASRCLSDRSIDHVVLERSAVANAWRTERWDSLRLLTPNWMTRLPGHDYDGPDPDGYMRAAEVASFLESYRTAIDAPVHAGVTVGSVAFGSERHRVVTDAGEWRCRSVVVATGAAGTPRVPAVAHDLPARVQQLTAHRYRNPDALADGGVLVVGASASGLQIADELTRAGRDVTIAVGEHIRLPRRYRGMDIHWWMDSLGLLDDRWTDQPDLVRARRLPSLGLVGTPERRDLDLGTLGARGVRVVGRLVGAQGGKAAFSGGLANLVAGADLKLTRLLDAIDEHARTAGLDAELPDPDRPAPVVVGEPTLQLDLDRIGTVVWATGYRPNVPFLPDHLLDAKGAIRHYGGVMDAPGAYVLGLPFMRRRKSSFIDGVGADAREVIDHLAAHLETHAAGRGSGLARSHGRW